MSQSNNKRDLPGKPQQNIDLSVEAVNQILETQKLKVLNEAREISLREKELEFTAKHAEKSLDHQAELLKKQPQENRKTFTRFFWVVGGLVFIFLGFLTLWLYLGKDEFAFKFLQAAGYIITTVIGYLAGNYEKKKGNKANHKSDDIEDIEVSD